MKKKKKFYKGLTTGFLVIALLFPYVSMAVESEIPEGAIQLDSSKQLIPETREGSVEFEPTGSSDLKIDFPTKEDVVDRKDTLRKAQDDQLRKLTESDEEFSFVDGEYTLVLEDSVKDEDKVVRRVLNALPDTYSSEKIGEDVYLISQDETKVEKNQKFSKEKKNTIKKITNVKGVFSFEPNFYSEASTPYIPNDPFFGPSQWYLRNTGTQIPNSSAGQDIQAETAWDITRGSNSIVIANIDAGTYLNNPEIDGNLWINTDEVAGNGIDDDGNGYVDDRRGFDFADNDPTVTDAGNPSVNFSHGTGVTSVMVAETNNSTGMAGICHFCKVMPLKVYSDSTYNNNYFGWTSADVVESINYARVNGARVINLELQGGSFNTSLQNAIYDAANAGLIIVSAAGNYNLSSPDYPAAYDQVIAVAAVRNDGVKKTYSNYGSWVDVAAPVGHLDATNQEVNGVIAASNPNQGQNLDYALVAGTSFAAPMVSASVALALSIQPSLRQDEVEAFLQASSLNLNAVNPSLPAGSLGAGMLKTKNFLDAVRDWKAVGSGDIDNDGRADDVIWRNQVSGLVSIAYMQGTTVQSSDYVRWSPGGDRVVLGSNWEIEGLGDFDGDGREDDILWHDTASASTVIWYMQGNIPQSSAPVFISSGVASTVGAPWEIIDTADMDGDGRIDDIVWYNNADGGVVTWYMDNNNLMGGAYMTLNGSNVYVGAPWKLRGVLDSDGDGRKDDFAWFNESDTTVTVWFMEDGAISGGGQVNYGGVPLSVGSSFNLNAFIDIDSDGLQDDFVWENKFTKSQTIWRLNALVAQSGGGTMLNNQGQTYYAPGN
jgi:hypothetical protein